VPARNCTERLAQIGINLRSWQHLVDETTGSAKPDTTPDMWVHWVSTDCVAPENWSPDV